MHYVLCIISSKMKVLFYVTYENLTFEMSLGMLSIDYFILFVLFSSWVTTERSSRIDTCTTYPFINRCTPFSIIWIKPIIFHVIYILSFCLKVSYGRGSHCFRYNNMIDFRARLKNNLISQQIISTFSISFSSYNHLLLKWAKLSSAIYLACALLCKQSYYLFLRKRWISLRTQKVLANFLSTMASVRIWYW